MLRKGRAPPIDLLYRLFGDGSPALPYAVAAGVVLLLSLLLTFAMRALAVRTGMLKAPRDRDVHRVPVPKLGGVAIYLAFVAGILLFEPLTGSRPDVLSHQAVDANGFPDQLRGLLLGGTVAVLVGLIDDLYNLRPGLHFMGQLLAASVALATGLHPVPGISNPLNGLYAHPEQHRQILLAAPVAVAFTLFWIVGMMNTVNFLDGLDGLAAGVVTIAALGLALWSGRLHPDPSGPVVGSQVLALAPLILAAALVGFLFFNWFPARIFMGDAGAQFAGFALGVLAILGPAKIGTALLVVAVPILDLAWVFIRRPASGRSFSSADREHLHHRLLDLKLSQPAIVLIFYGVCGLLGLLDLALSRASKLVAFVLVAAIMAVVLALLASAGKPDAPPPPPARWPRRKRGVL